MKAQTKAICILGILIVSFLISCIVVSKELVPHHLGQGDKILTTKQGTFNPVHIHLSSGELVTMDNGFTLLYSEDSTFMIPRRNALRYSFDRSSHQEIEELDFAEVEFVETVHKSIDGLAFLLSAPGGIVAGTVLFFAIFGSCPTVYSINNDTAYLEAETFSYSISKRFEMEDVDKLEFAKIENGRLLMELRNEALETHYLNTFKILSVEHDSSEHIFPSESNNLLDWRKELIKVGPYIPITSIIDKTGHHVAEKLLKEDDDYYSTSQIVLDDALTKRDYQDWIDIEFEVPEVQEEIFLALKLRSALLNTVLLYDMFLNKQNFNSIDWTASTTNQMLYAYNFAKWYRKHFGLHIEIWEDGKYKEVQQIGDSGPITWSKLGYKIDLNKGGKQKMRLKFISDNWHIDWLGISLSGSQEVNFLSHDIINKAKLNPHLNINERLLEDDDSYLITYPGQSYNFEFAIEKENDAKEISLFVNSKGFYIEWIRKDWLLPDENESYKEELVLNDKLIHQLYQQWECEKATMEDYFFETMIPVSKLKNTE